MMPPGNHPCNLLMYTDGTILSTKFKKKDKGYQEITFRGTREEIYKAIKSKMYLFQEEGENNNDLYTK